VCERECVCSVGKLPAKVYVGHSVYKAKAVLTVSPRPGSLKKESLLIYETRGSKFLVFVSEYSFVEL
jgi:hypothetical protein